MRFVTPDMARRVSADCVQALCRLLQPDGRFIYRYRLDEPKSEDKHYSSVRHIGAVWYLLEADSALGPLDGARDAAVKAGEHMIEHFLVPYLGNQALAVLSEGFAKLGGSGLAISALCRLYDATGDARYLDLAGQSAAFVLAQQQDTGDLVQVRQYPLGVVHPARDAFQAGQAVMGLMCLYEQTGEQKLLDAVLKSVKFLDTASYGVRTFSHWMLYGLDKVYGHVPNPAIAAYAERIASRMLEDTSYRKAGLSTPIACRTEGLLAYDRLLGNAGIEPSDARRTNIMRHIRQNLSAVLKFRADGGVFIEGYKKPEVRIDFIFHPGRAFLAYALQAGNESIS
jgi:hypothetical protein